MMASSQPIDDIKKGRRVSISHSDIHDLPSVLEAVDSIDGFELDSTPTSLQNSVELAV